MESVYQVVLGDGRRAWPAVLLLAALLLATTAYGQERQSDQVAPVLRPTDVVIADEDGVARSHDARDLQRYRPMPLPSEAGAASAGPGASSLTVHDPRTGQTRAVPQETARVLSC